MHVAQVGFFLDPRQRGPEQLLQAWPSLTDIAEAAAARVDRLSLLQACASAASFQRNAVEYHFVAAAAHGEARAVAAACADRMIALLAELRPDVIHVHGLDFPRAVARLARRMPGTPILLQDHANRVPRPWRWPLWRRGLACAAGIAACAREQLQPYRRAFLLRSGTRLFEIAESSSHFAPADPARARAATGVYGDPAVLWVGRLNANKDPLTVLEAVARAATRMPGLHLWACHGSGEWLPRIEAWLASQGALRERVHLLGTVAHESVEALMNASDLYVSASRREGSGYALIEALACGLPPVVSDIPSFRALTGRGQVGALWPCGDAAALAASLEAAAAQPRAQARARTRAWFERELSFAAVGRKLGEAYAGLLAASRRG